MIRDIQNIVESILPDGKLKGEQYWSCCPFHTEREPSFNINIKTGKFNCFGCGKSGSIIKFLSLTKQISYAQVVEKFVDDDIRDKFNIDYLINELDKEFINIDEQKEILSWNFLEQFEDIEEGDQFFNYLLGRRIYINTMKKFFLKKCSQVSSKWYNRVIIPILDEDGDLISIVGRSIKTDKQSIKVRNLKSTSLNYVMFGLNHCLRSDKILIVEGPFDCMYLRQEGFPVVACLGKSLNYHRQKILIEQGVKEVYLMLDPDVREKNPKMLEDYKKELSKNFKTIVVNIDKDPDELTREDLEILEQKMKINRLNNKFHVQKIYKDKKLVQRI